jgi:hypothetical protein
VARLVAAGTARRWSHPAQARSLSGAPKLNSIPRGPVSQHVTNRDIDVQALEKAGRAAEIARLLRQCWSLAAPLAARRKGVDSLAKACGGSETRGRIPFKSGSALTTPTTRVHLL